MTPTYEELTDMFVRLEGDIQQLAQKIKDPEAYTRMVEQNKKFNAWCSIMGYFPHSKYFEAWQAALEANK